MSNPARPHRSGGRDSEAILNGRPLQTLLAFAAPIILGNIFQQLYNIIDAVVVGRFLGDIPLAGISVASPIMDVANALIIGGTIGVGVLTAQICGAGDWDHLKVTNTTAQIGGAALTLLLSAAGLLLSGPILTAQGTDPAARAEALNYLRIIFTGLIFNFFYNYYASILRSYGDSRTPFLILLASSTLHAALDLLLVGALGFGVRSIAFSTVFCQMVSAVWCAVYTFRRCPPLAFRRSELVFSPAAGRKVLNFAWAAALQQAVIYIGRLLVQGMLTDLGTSTVTGYNMGIRTESFLFCFSQGISSAMVVCLSQNLGNENYNRVRRFFYLGLKVNVLLSGVFGALCLLFPEQIIGIFSNTPEVIAAGAQYTGTMALFYVTSFFSETTQGFFRGMGRLRLTMIASMSQVVLRVILSYLLVPLWGITGICASVVTGWCLLMIIEGCYGLRVARRVGVSAPEKDREEE